MKILVSAGEASGDLYAAALVRALQARLPNAEFFGCTGHRLRAAGVRTVVDAASLNVVGLVEVIRHIPRIKGEFNKLLAAATRERPDFAILTDSPDFHLRLAPQLRKLGIPVIYLIAPQVWAWRKGRIKIIRRVVNHLLCIFPFEEDFFQASGVPATYIGHPLTRLVGPETPRADFFARHRLPPDRPLLTLLPGSRPGEIARHLPVVCEAARILAADGVSLVLATPKGAAARMNLTTFAEPLRAASIKHIEGETWDAIAHADAALAASGTVTIEAALLGTPLAAFYKVSPWSWWMGRFLVDVPFFSMVNLVAGRKVIPELIQDACTGERLAAEARQLLADGEARLAVQMGLQEVARKLSTDEDPMEKAAEIVLKVIAHADVLRTGQ
ncbi:MAG: lipid-A-disaccharide synthase [Bryobacterales bacterium]|nr:lipid-A-disaccharide synthase [Bryobacterales bacterium]